jgi:hypothetical protein
MDEYITKSKLKEYIEKYCNPEGCTRITAEDVYKTALTTIECVPTADVREEKHGRWIKSGNEKKCSVCQFVYYSNNDEWNGCPNCLSIMDGRRDE